MPTRRTHRSSCTSAPLHLCRCGSADVLETLGVDLALPAAGIERCIKEVGIAFIGLGLG